MLKVQRFFLEIKKSDYNADLDNNPSGTKIYLDSNKDININKFFYKQIGKDHYWRDRLLWSDKEWVKYVNNKNLQTWIMKVNNSLVGFYEQELHESKSEIELIQMGIMKEFHGRKLGSILLQHIIRNAFNANVRRLWVHTCSLDHKYALKNYLSRGFKIFKKEEINFET